MSMDPVRRERIRSTLIIVILVTIPCYMLGLVTIWISNGVKVRARITPSVTSTDLFGPTSTPTLIEFTPTPGTPQFTATGTKRPTFTPTITFIIPTRTVSSTPTLTDTPQPTQTSSPTQPVPPTDTLNPPDVTPSSTPTVGPEGS